MKQNNWKLWDQFPNYGNLLYQRAIEQKPEMESAKALCKIIKPLYNKGMNILDVGCGAGHYLLSLRKRIDKDINYTGIDSTKYYIKLAKKAFKKINFIDGDIYQLPFKDKSFDICICNNVILHLPPPPIKPINELVRVAKKFIVIRTLFGEDNYIIKRIYCFREKKVISEKYNLIDSKGNINSFGYYNMYTENYFKTIIENFDKNIKVEIIADNKFKYFNNTNLEDKLLAKNATKVINGMQISGNLLMDWRFIIIRKNYM